MDARELDICNSLAFDSNEDIICVDGKDMRSGSQTSYRLLFLKYDKDGNQMWNNTGGIIIYDAMALDSSDNIYVGYRTRMAKYNQTGYLDWPLLWGTTLLKIKKL